MLALSITAIVGCGGSDSSSGNNGTSIRNVITTAEFLLVDPPSLSELLAVLRIITQATANLSGDPDRFARELFDGVRDAIATTNPVSGANLDELFELSVDRLSRESWRLILTDPIRGVIAPEVFDRALRAALQQYSCNEHSSHIGAKTEAFFQVLWLILVLQLTSDSFLDEFSLDHSEGLSVAAAAMLRSNASFAIELFDRFPSASFDDLIQLLLTSPFRFVPGGSTQNAMTFVSDRQTLDGGYSGTVEQRLGGDENVVLHVNRCNDNVRAQVLVLKSDGSVDAEWRLTGTIDQAGTAVLQTVDRLDRFFVTTTRALCGDLTLTLTTPGNAVDGDWDASSVTCPFNGRIQATAEP